MSDSIGLQVHRGRTNCKFEQIHPLGISIGNLSGDSSNATQELV